MKQLGTEPYIGEGCELIEALLGVYTDIGPHSSIVESVLGDYSYCAGYNQIIYSDIGKFCSIATGVRINPGNHPYATRVAQHHFTYRPRQFGFADRDDERFFNWRRVQQVRVGHDVWIGHNAVLMPGVTIGDGAVIGTGAIVTHDVGAYEVAVGVPARVVKRRFPLEVAQALSRIRWWDWDHETIRQRLKDFNHIERFIKLYDPGVEDEQNS